MAKDIQAIRLNRAIDKASAVSKNAERCLRQLKKKNPKRTLSSLSPCEEATALREAAEAALADARLMLSDINEMIYSLELYRDAALEAEIELCAV